MEYCGGLWLVLRFVNPTGIMHIAIVASWKGGHQILSPSVWQIVADNSIQSTILVRDEGGHGTQHLKPQIMHWAPPKVRSNPRKRKIHSDSVKTLPANLMDPLAN